MNDLKLTSEQEKMVNIFVRALPTLRKEVGVSQTLLGQKIGKSRQTISLIERGASPLTWDTFLSIILFFKVNYNKDKKVINDLEKFLIIDENDERLK
ncbi:MAG: helix-turn-helix transcriptional regulator [Oscillospiraceae bacterium]